MSKTVPQPAEAKLFLPKGFKINVFAEGNFREPRWMTLAPNGDVFLSDARANSVIVLRDKNKDGVAEERFVFSDKLSQPFGMAFHKGWFYVANTDSIVRFTYKPGQTSAVGEPEKLVELTPGGYNQHWTRNILFSKDGTKMFVSIGSATNVRVEADPRRAAISVYDPDGKNHRIYAAGLRNPIGLAWNPKTGELWTAVNERDGLGDDLVPDYVTSVKEGGFYGWPYSYIGQNEEPRRKGENPELVSRGRSYLTFCSPLTPPHSASNFTKARCSRRNIAATHSSPCMARGTVRSSPDSRSSASDSTTESWSGTATKISSRAGCRMRIRTKYGDDRSGCWSQPMVAADHRRWANKVWRVSYGK